MASVGPAKPASDLLKGPAPALTVTRIDFTKTPLPQYKGRYAVVLDGVLSKQECEDLVNAAEAHSNGVWDRAKVNAGGGREVLATDTRNCGRIIWDSEEIVARLWSRIESSVPELRILKDSPLMTGWRPVKWGDVWKLTRLNERMRFLKYGKGEYFKAHNDGCYATPDGSERSWLTLHLYLNDAESDPANPLKGGATAFFEPCAFLKEAEGERYDVHPKTGRVLIFQHRDLTHSGDEVLQGIKLTMRTEVMYTLDGVNGNTADN